MIIIPGNSASLIGAVLNVAIVAAFFLLMWRHRKSGKGRKQTVHELQYERQRAYESLDTFIKGTGKPFELRKVIFTGKEYTAFVRYTGQFSNTFYVAGTTLAEVKERLSERIFR